jgi:hypothetical protein
VDLVNTVTNLRVPLKAGNFFSTLGITSQERLCSLNNFLVLGKYNQV